MRKASAIIAAVFGLGLALCPRAAHAQAYTPAKIWYQPSSGTFHAVSNGIDQAIGSGGTGTVTTFGVSPTGLLGPVFSCTVANPSTTPTLTCTVSSQTANTVFAAPNGSSGSPTFRALVAGDIPTLNYAGNSGSAIATLVQSLTGCTTATYVFTPQASDCVAPSSGTGTVTDGTGSTTANQVALTTTTAHQIAYDAKFTDNAGAVTAVSYSTSGTTAGLIGLTGSVTNPAIPGNSAGWLAPASATFTSWVGQLPSTAPSGGQALSCGTPASNISTCSWVTPATTIGSGTAALGTAAISSGTCATVVTVAATGVATTDTITYTPNTDPTAVTGYAPSASGSLYIWAYPTSGNVNFKVCNNTSGSITPSALTLNWRVSR